MTNDYSNPQNTRLGIYSTYQCPYFNDNVSTLTATYTIPGWRVIDAPIKCFYNKGNTGPYAAALSTYSSALSYASTQLWIWGGWASSSLLPMLISGLCALQKGKSSDSSSVLTSLCEYTESDGDGSVVGVDGNTEASLPTIIFTGNAKTFGPNVATTIANIAVNGGVTDLYQRSTAVALIADCVTLAASNDCSFLSLSGMTVCAGSSCTQP